MSLAIVAAVSAAIILFIYLPICIYYLVNVWNERNEMFMNKRFVKMTMGLHISLIIYLFIVSLSSLSIAIANELLFVFAAITSFAAFWMFLYFEISKAWMIYYNAKWTHYTLSSEWTTVIDPKSHHKNWYLLNRTKYGNLYYISKLFAVIFVIGAVISILSAMTIWSFQLIGNKIIITFITNFVVFIPFLFHLVIICKTPHIEKRNDLFLINWESINVAKLVFIWLIIYVLMWIVGIICFEHHYYMQLLWCFVISFHLFSLIATLIVIVGCKYVVKYNKANNMDDDNANFQRFHSKSIDRTKIDKNKTDISLNSILTNKDTIHLFMRHLSNEYSIECLLSFIEFWQYRKYLEAQIGDTKQEEIDDNDDNHKGVSGVKLPETLPKSKIVNNLQTDFKKKAFDLYMKYICIGCEFEININGHLRQTFIDLMGNVIKDENNYNRFIKLNISMQDIIDLYQICENEMYNLLIYSFARFKITNGYLECLQILYPS